MAERLTGVPLVSHWCPTGVLLVLNPSVNDEHQQLLLHNPVHYRYVHGSTGLQSTMDEEREEGGPTSKTTLSGEHGRQSKAKSPEQQERAHSPEPSCVSMKSDWSMSHPLNFKDGRPSREERQPHQRSKVTSSQPVQQSTKKRRVQQQRADSPRPSCVSMKSDWSMDNPLNFKDVCPSREESKPHQRSKVTSAQSVQQHQTELIKSAEENAHAFLDKELKKLWRDLFPDYPQCSQREEEEVDAKNKEQRRRAIEGVVDITKLCLMEMNQQELADSLWSGMRRLF
ncbi:unnamed protein product [Boreogadus saida]